MDYRSPNTKAGTFNQLGTLHVHVDGLEETALLTGLVKKLESEGFPGKIHRVLESIEGPQRLTEPTYNVHTTGFPGRENFTSFSTSLLSCRADVRKLITLLLREIPKNLGIVVELEQVCAQVKSDGAWEEQDLENILDLGLDEVPLQPRPTLPIEIHHMVDVPLQAGQDAIHLDSLLTDKADQAPIPYGGWFLFEKSGLLAYRSNSFSNTQGVQKKVLREYERLIEHESIIRVKDARLRTIVERVLGAWRV